MSSANDARWEARSRARGKLPPVIRELALVALLLGATSPLVAHAQSASMDRAGVMAMLRGVEDVPDAARWRQMPNAVGALGEIALDPAEQGIWRMRAIGALSAFSTPEVQRLLERCVRQTQSIPLLYRASIEALAFAFRARAMPFALDALAHQDPAVREGGIRALLRIDTAASRAALQRYADRETDPGLRHAAQGALEAR
jgi:hypothetical protein